MNKRIQELLDQTYTVSNHRQYPAVRWNGQDAFMATFAELIVQECIEQLRQEGDEWEQFSRNPPKGQEANASPALFAAYRLKEDAVSRLEEHFGVK